MIIITLITDLGLSILHFKCTDKEKVFGLFYRQNVIDYRKKIEFLIPHGLIYIKNIGKY